jgi:hypothetical protein
MFTGTLRTVEAKYSRMLSITHSPPAMAVIH